MSVLRALPRSLRGSIATATTGACLLVPATASAQDFPSASWIDLMQNGATLGDVSNDSFGPGIVDLVGETGAPAASIAGDANFVYLRLRVDGDPRGTGGLASSGWGCAIDNDGDYGAYEFLVFADGTTDTVELWDNLTTPGGPGDAADTLRGSYPVAPHARVVAAGAPALGTPGDPDHYLELAVPTLALIGAGFDPTGPIVAVCGSTTSGATAALAADCTGTNASCSETTLEEAGSDPLLCGLAGCALCNTDAACGALCLPCANPTPVCDAEAMACEGCGDDDDCFSPTPSCVTDAGPAQGSCVECTSDGDCDASETCNLATHTCEFHCTADADCAAPTPVCETVAGVCVECTATDATACAADELCEVTSGTCVECLADGDCGGAESGRVCLASNACADGCRGTGNGCVPPLVCSSSDDTVGACVPAGGGGAGGGGQGGQAGAPVVIGGAPATAGAAGAPATAGAAGAAVVAGDGGVPAVAGSAGTPAVAGSAGTPVVATGGTAPETGGTDTGGTATGGTATGGTATGGTATGGEDNGGSMSATGGVQAIGGAPAGGTPSEGGEGGEAESPAGGSPAAGGSGTRPGGSSTGDDDVDSTSAPNAIEGGGCDCATPRQSGGGAWLLFGLPAFLLARRRRRRA